MTLRDLVERTVHELEREVGKLGLHEHLAVTRIVEEAINMAWCVDPRGPDWEEDL